MPGGAENGQKVGDTVNNYSSGHCGNGSPSKPNPNHLYVPVGGAAFSDSQWERYGYNYLTAAVIIRKEGADSNNPGQKFFKLRYTTGTVVGDEDGFFAVGDRNETGISSYIFNFKSNCEYSGGGMVLRIRDVDVHANNGGVSPEVTLTNVTTGRIVTKLTKENVAEGQTDFDYEVPASPETRYSLVYSNIAAGNGLNVGLPFSEFDEYDVGGPFDDCYDPPGPDPVTPDCNTYRHNMGANSRYRFTVFARDGNYMNGGPPNREDTVTGAGNRTWRGFDYGNHNYVNTIELTTGDNPANDPNGFDFPEPKGPDWIVYVERWQRTNPDSPGTGTYKYGLLDDPIRVMNCYSAVCESMSIVSGTLPGRPTGVEAGQNFRIGMTFRNTGQDDLPGSMRGHNLTATDAGWSFVHGLNTGIPKGGSHYFEIPLSAPSGRTTKDLSIYPDYYNLFALANHAPEGERAAIRCGVTISTYERFQLIPQVNSVSPNDPEDPTHIRSNTGIDQNKDPTIPYTSAGIPAISTRSLTLKRGGATIANLIGPVNDGRHFSSPDPYPYSDEYNNASIPRDFQAGDQLCANISINVDEGWIGPRDDVVDRDGQPRHAGEQCNRVVDRPFVRMYGGDVFAGGMFGQPGAGTNGDIKTYIKRATNVPEGSAFGAGSGVEFAAFALGVIDRTADQSEGFTSASLRNSTPNAPSGLSFASPGAGFGGNFASAHMATDYFNSTKRPETAIQNRSTPLNVNTELADRQQSGFKPPSGTKLRLNGGANYDRHHSLYIEGDVFISNDITYNTGGADGWGTLSEIPSFALYVKGNIYISAGVTRLDGLYVAQPNGNAGGKIYTCATPADGSLYGPTQIFDACRTQLKVNGAFVAQETKLLRTAYTLSDVPVAASAVPEIPGAAAFAGIDNGAYAAAPAHYPAVQAGRSKCFNFIEPADPNWSNADNRFCYNSNHTLKWYHGGPSGNPSPGEECVSFNNPAEEHSHTWWDNFLCAPAGSNVQLQAVGAGTNPPGKECVAIHEISWAAGEPGGGNPWANAKLCYRASIGGTPGTPAVPLQYVKETFHNDHAAESFRLTPEMFLARPVQQPIGSQSNGKFDQYLSLPPVL